MERTGAAPFHPMHDRDEGISAADYARLRKLIYDEAGIALGSERATMLEGRIRRRLKELALPSYHEYCRFLFTGEGRECELIPLIDVVTTNKTDFFREPKHFDFLVATALPELTAAAGNRRPMLVWSAGCSTGEEPYTLAIVLTEYALSHPGFSFRILATDISTVVLRKASLGIYPADAVRPVPPPLQARYLMRSRDPGLPRVRIVPELRSLVEFRRLNFMDHDYRLSTPVDAIFCRNVIIYFDRPTQQRILRKLAACLASGGFLFVGHAETLHDMDLPLVPVAPSLYRKLAAHA
jgi:chemotaxis protein methyltransferase CheR